NTDFLMSLAYTAAGFLFICSSTWKVAELPSRGLSALPGAPWLALAGGGLTALAAQTNPKGSMNLVFFAILIVLTRRWHEPRLFTEDRRWHQGLVLFGLACVGFLGGSIPFLAYIGMTHSLSAYWQYVWVWGSRYARYYAPGTLVSQGLRLIGS